MLFSILTAILLTAVTLAAAEGIYSLANWYKPQRSISHQFLALELAGQADRGVPVAGDSMAFGAMVDDENPS
jgi:hypothetical protein